MELLLEELTGGFPSLEQLARVTIRVVAAAVLGAVVGIQRER